jgi:hypothetical protein
MPELAPVMMTRGFFKEGMMDSRYRFYICLSAVINSMAANNP